MAEEAPGQSHAEEERENREAQSDRQPMNMICTKLA
jgi:hypothetical protein